MDLPSSLHLRFVRRTLALLPVGSPNFNLGCLYLLLPAHAPPAARALARGALHLCHYGPAHTAPRIYPALYRTHTLITCVPRDEPRTPTPEL